jgi:hypothetical protein
MWSAEVTNRLALHSKFFAVLALLKENRKKSMEESNIKAKKERRSRCASLK